MSKLSETVLIIVESMDLNKQDVIELIASLQKEFDIPANGLDAKPSTAEKKEESDIPANGLDTKPSTVEKEKKEEVSVDTSISFEVEVLYQNGRRSSHPIRGQRAIGIIIPCMSRVLYLDGSEDKGTRQMAKNYISNLPHGYRWRLMNKEEAQYLKSRLSKVNATLKQIGGLALTNVNYMLDDDWQRQGYVRYTAPI